MVARGFDEQSVDIDVLRCSGVVIEYLDFSRDTQRTVDEVLAYY